MPIAPQPAKVTSHVLRSQKNVIARWTLHLCGMKRNTKTSMPDIIVSGSESIGLDTNDTLFCRTKQLGVASKVLINTCKRPLCGRHSRWQHPALPHGDGNIFSAAAADHPHLRAACRITAQTTRTRAAAKDRVDRNLFADVQAGYVRRLRKT